jgi:hypothetical protein
MLGRRPWVVEENVITQKMIVKMRLDLRGGLSKVTNDIWIS